MAFDRVQQLLPDLSEVLFEMYPNLTSTTALDRDHKCGKRVLSCIRRRLCNGMEEKRFIVTKSSTHFQADINGKL